MVPLLIKTFEGYQKEGYPLWIQRSSHGQHNLIEEHGHDFIEVVYVVHGGGMHKINEEYYEIRAGDVYTILPGESHSYLDVADSGLEIINCLFLPETVRNGLPLEPTQLHSLAYLAPFYDILEHLPKRSRLTSRQSSVVLGLLASMIQEIKLRDTAFETILSHKLIDLLILLSRYHSQRELEETGSKPLSSGHEILIRKVCAFLESNYQYKITGILLAQHFSISQRHLNRVFRQETGTSITSKLQNIRIERAKHMLHETERSIESISLAVGFGDTSFFTRLFARIVGDTPSSFRKQAKNRRIS
ncbi:helix-turn-helix domain-containing protein [Paenibacillus sp. WQ 127069]|uniref:Helix-turn-helix domain-containing protein n=1 Tax=Paenibacillus baimaensis TaxID=2982185 RepID=A0ABT2UTA7_9BACL|nr:helix-turn-helix domain-containing protein [Paenibacillus sp. WQ 127069]MCU6796914.1 helix-turn-helix domain-containing protein [Paenibacillus sp. WQ 127069]